MKGLSFSILLIIGLVSICGPAYSQPPTNSVGTIMWPAWPFVGIGTEQSGLTHHALQIHYDSSNAHTKQAELWLSEGINTGSANYGVLGLRPSIDSTYSTISSGKDLILHQNQDGDIIITNFSHSDPTHTFGTAIRFATTGDTDLRPVALVAGHHDLERLTIMGNGNVGIDLPPDLAGLDSARDQVQIGGSSIVFPGEIDPKPGLTIYGGNRFEELPKLGGGQFPGDSRYIAFNSYLDHTDNSPLHSKRFARMASSGIAFDDNEQGTLQLWAQPYDPLYSNNSHHNMTLNLTGQYGLSLWQYNADSIIDPYHHIFDAYPPGVLPVSSVTRNTNGLFYHHTPVYIGSDSTRMPLVNFQNLPVKPDMGDDTTWMLVVNGPMLAKEIFVLDSAWADYVFDPDYELKPLNEVENYIKDNHHLPDIEPASKIATTGLPVGRTEAALTKKVEELTLYTIELNKEVEALKAEVEELKNQKEK